jgi:hypothetical protein
VCNETGFSFVAVLLALLIAAALYFGYFKMQSVIGEKATSIQAIDVSRAMACRANRQNIERAIAFWSVNHPDEEPTLAGLQADGVQIPTCPEGGRYEIAGRAVRCSVHR